MSQRPNYTRSPKLSTLATHSP